MSAFHQPRISREDIDIAVFATAGGSSFSLLMIPLPSAVSSVRKATVNHSITSAIHLRPFFSYITRSFFLLSVIEDSYIRSDLYMTC
ncbi:MAG TPA: hypothetical protein DEF07_09080 [Nitrosomonas sp.]|nr:hypothetical protein [Nitrosomonas sp.]